MYKTNPLHTFIPKTKPEPRRRHPTQQYWTSPSPTTWTKSQNNISKKPGKRAVIKKRQLNKPAWNPQATSNSPIPRKTPNFFQRRRALDPNQKTPFKPSLQQADASLKSISYEASTVLLTSGSNNTSMVSNVSRISNLNKPVRKREPSMLVRAHRRQMNKFAEGLSPNVSTRSISPMTPRPSPGGIGQLKQQQKQTRHRLFQTISDLSDSFNESGIFKEQLLKQRKNKVDKAQPVCKISTKSTNESATLRNVFKEGRLKMAPGRTAKARLRDISEVFENGFKKDDQLKVILNKEDNSIRLERVGRRKPRAKVRGGRPSGLNKAPQNRGRTQKRVDLAAKPQMQFSRSMIDFKSKEIDKQKQKKAKGLRKDQRRIQPHGKLNYSDIELRANAKKHVNLDFLPKKWIRRKNLHVNNKDHHAKLTSPTPARKAPANAFNHFKSTKQLQIKPPSKRSSKKAISELVTKPGYNAQFLSSKPDSVSPAPRRSRSLSRSFNRNKHLSREEQYLQSYPDDVVFRQIARMRRLDSRIVYVLREDMRHVIYNYLLKIAMYVSKKCYSHIIFRAMAIIDQFLSKLVRRAVDDAKFQNPFEGASKQTLRAGLHHPNMPSFNLTSFQLISLVAFYVASKHDDIYPLSSKDVLHLYSNPACGLQSVRETEFNLLEVLGYKVNFALPKDCIELLVSKYFAGLGKAYKKQLKLYALMLCKFCLFFYSFVLLKYDKMAIVCVLAALSMFRIAAKNDKPVKCDKMCSKRSQRQVPGQHFADCEVSKFQVNEKLVKNNFLRQNQSLIRNFDYELHVKKLRRLFAKRKEIIGASNYFDKMYSHVNWKKISK